MGLGNRSEDRTSCAVTGRILEDQRSWNKRPYTNEFESEKRAYQFARHRKEEESTGVLREDGLLVGIQLS